MKYELRLHGGLFDGKVMEVDMLGRCVSLNSTDRNGQLHRHDYEYTSWATDPEAGRTVLDCQFTSSTPGSTREERLARTIKYIMDDGIKE